MYRDIVYVYIIDFANYVIIVFAKNVHANRVS